MSPHFPPFTPFTPLRPTAGDPGVPRQNAPGPRFASRPLHVQRRASGPPFLLLRAVITVAGVAGFLGLLVTAAYVRSAQEALRVSAFVWFLGFGVARVLLDRRASRASRRREVCWVEPDRWLGGGGG
jgi:hypothetical protein